MNTPTLEQIAYRWRNGDSLPGVNNECVTDGANRIIQEAEQEVSVRRERERQARVQEQLNSIDDD